MNKKGVTRKEVLTLGGAAIGASALGGAAVQAAAGKPKNILVIVVDQLRSLGDVPAALPLPNIYGFRRQAWDFQNYHVNLAPCGPSRSVIYTGQHPQKTGVYTNPPGEYTRDIYDGRAVIELPHGFPTIGTMLREQGYYTAYKGKWHLTVVNQKTPGGGYPYATQSLEEFGFSDYNFDGEVSGLTWAGYGHDGVVAADAVNLLRRFAKGKTKGKPWFFAINFINPHDIMYLDPTDGENPTNGAVGPSKPPPGMGIYDKVWNFKLPRSYYADNLSTKPAVQSRLRRPETEVIWEDYQNYYYNCIRDVDQHIGTVLKALDDLGLAKDTIVVLTADHGEMGGAHGLRGKGAYMYKECLRVPFMVRHPETPRGGVTKALASGVDITPTVLGWAGMSDQARAARYPALKGVNFGGVVGSAQARSRRDEAGILFNYMTPAAVTPGGRAQGVPTQGVRDLFRGVFDGRYKFARYFGVNGHNTPTNWEELSSRNDLELYDTTTDPDELVNLARDVEKNRPLMLSLNAKLNALMASEVGRDDASIYQNRVPTPPPPSARPARGGGGGGGD